MTNQEEISFLNKISTLNSCIVEWSANVNKAKFFEGHPSHSTPYNIIQDYIHILLKKL